MVRHGKKNSVPGTKIIKEAERTGISLDSSTITYITTIGKRLI